MSFPIPQPGASLLLSHRLSPHQQPQHAQQALHAQQRRTVVIIGTSRLAASRLYACAEAGAWPVVLHVQQQAVQQNGSTSEGDAHEHPDICLEIRHRIENSECSFVTVPASHQGGEESSAERIWSTLFDALDNLAPPESPYDSSESLECDPSLSTEEGEDERKEKLAKQQEQVKQYTAAVQARLSSTQPTSGTSTSASVPPQIFAVCVTTTLHTSPPTSSSSTTAAPAATTAGGAEASIDTELRQATLLTRLCRQRRIPINVADRPELCDFSFPAAHRFTLASSSASAGAKREGSTKGRASCLQIAVTTNGKGCRLAGRIRREVVSLLPKNVADAVENIGTMRGMAKLLDRDALSKSREQERRRRSSAASTAGKGGNEEEQIVKTATKPAGTSTPTATLMEEDESFDPTPINTPVPQMGTPSSPSSGHRTPTLQASSSFSNAVLVHQAKLASGVRASLNSQVVQAASSLSTATAGAGTTEADAAAAEDDERTKRRMRWVAQMSEYWPIDYLGRLDRDKMRALLDEYHEKEEKAGTDGLHQNGKPVNGSAFSVGEDEGEAEKEVASRGRLASAESTAAGSWTNRRPSQHSLILPPPAPTKSRKGHIYILGSGPGHPALLTRFAHKLLTSPDTHLVLSDKLVPAPVLALIPPSTPLVIARKFPGNAEGAQSELIALALQAAVKEGKNVVRLKQGDPFVYGRGGEEILAFRKAGVESTVVPGISSSIAGPGLLGIAVTQRGAADSMILCTGVGRGGKKVKLPGYERGRSLVLLMGVARIQAVVDILTKVEDPHTPPQNSERLFSEADRDGAPFPPYLPIAVVERASSADQRVIASTLSGIVRAIEQVGEQRPPGMILVGWSVLALEGAGDTTVLDDASHLADEVAAGSLSEKEAVEGLRQKDLARIDRWLDGRGYIVREGLDKPYTDALLQAKAESEAFSEQLQQHEAADTPKKEAVPNGKLVDPAVFSDPSNPAVGKRGTAGWSEGRYRGQAPQGGWMPGEEEYRPAADMEKYLADSRLPDTISR